jgi:transposase
MERRAKHSNVIDKETDTAEKVCLNRPGFGSVFCSRMEAMPKKYDPEFRERALRLLAEARPDHPNLMAAIRHVAGMLGMNPETLRVWQRRVEVDAGQRPGVPTDAAAENVRLRREVAELRKANEVLKAASVFFAKELDRPSTR